MNDSPVTVAELLRDATSRLRADSPTPALDARILLEHLTGLDHAAMLASPDRTLDDETRTHYRALVERRADGEPVAYITGHREFWSMDLEVTPDTLIPRPDTEVLVERALHHIPRDGVWNIADLGTGSGAIALAIARERPQCRVVATDRSDAALAVARRNAVRLQIGNVEFLSGEWCEALGKRMFDVIVSNPPYVAQNDPYLHEGDLRFEPQTALCAGESGLGELRRISACVPTHLDPGGWLILEHGHDQSEAVSKLLHDAGFTDINSVRDLSGIPRVAEGRRS